MPPEGVAFWDYLRLRWRLLAAVLGVAVTVSLGLSVVTPRKYTARVSLLIEPPSSNDPRAATAVSSIYLESLRTYEYFASSDHLFAQAAAKFGLRDPRNDSRPIEKLKKSVLKVSIPRNTKILEISVTLTDPVKAHALASHIAAQTIDLARSSGTSIDREMIDTATREAGIAAERERVTGERLSATRTRSPTIATLDAEIERLAHRLKDLDWLALRDAIQPEDQDGHERIASASVPAPGDLKALPGSRARIARNPAPTLEQEQTRLRAESGQLQNVLAARLAEIDDAAVEHNLAREQRDLADQRVRGLRYQTGTRTERITLLDPGFVPETPSSPNIPLNLFVAVALSLIVTITYLTIGFTHSTEAAREQP